MGQTDYRKKLRELVLNWKLRLVVSALFSILGLSILISTISGFVVGDFDTLDQTIVGVAVFVIVIPIYLIAADLPKIDVHTIAEMLNRSIPELNDNVELVLKSPSEMNQQEKARLREIENVINDENLYRFLPMRPVKQAAIVMIICLALTAAVIVYFH